LFPSDGKDEETLLKNADVAMYHAKEKGRNNFQFFKDSLNTAVVERLSMENNLRKATERGEFILLYQPKLSIATGRITGMEALLRWRSSELGELQPAEFIPLAERTGMIVPIGAWVLKTACLQSIAWQEELGERLPVAVNVSAKQLHHPGFVSLVQTTLKETGLEPSLLELELTETAALEDMDRSEQVVAALVESGVRLVIDDFGAGHSSLTRLRRLPMHAVKIDRAFIRNLPRREKDRALVTTIIEMARRLHVGVIAEGVETVDQLTTLQSILGGIASGGDPRALQGFLFSRPVSPEEISELLRRKAALKSAAKAAGSTG
jgi:EAL domain-containing protein (putative c-di-GMP-specific phosphodiesterase class I)